MLDFIQSQMNPVHTFTPHFFKIHSNIALTSTPRSPKWHLVLELLFLSISTVIMPSLTMLNSDEGMLPTFSSGNASKHSNVLISVTEQLLHNNCYMLRGTGFLPSPHYIYITWTLETTVFNSHWRFTPTIYFNHSHLTLMGYTEMHV